MKVPSKSSHFVAVVPLLLAGATARGQVPETRSPITAVMVAQALQGRGVEVAPAQVNLPFALSARHPAPGLRVLGAYTIAPNLWRVRLACAEAGECLAFAATIRLQGGTTAESMSTLNPSSPSPAAREPHTAAEGPALKAGQPAVLLLEEGPIHIHIPVVSIDSGAVGNEVRVSSSDHKQIFRGVVIAANTVEGGLP